MASREIQVGLRIGAVVGGSLRAAFGSVRGTVTQLGRATDGLTAKQRQIGTALSAAVAAGGSGLARLRAQYDRVGRTIDQLKVKQDRLNASIARGETLASRRQELRGQALETIGTAAVLGAPVFKSMAVSAAFQDQTNDIAITGGFDQAEEKRLGDVLRGAAIRWNQFQSDVAAGAQVLIAGGIENVDQLSAYAPIMAKTATATRASMDDLGSVAIALNDNLGIGAQGYERALNMLAFAGKKGQFELADMAKWLPQLTPQMAALGITGERAVAEIGASLQIARRGAGTNDEAANNFKNFLSKITAPDTLKSFEDAGINLQASMRNLVEGGLTPVQAMLEIITNYVGSKGPEAAKEFEAAMQIKDEAERQSALDRLNEAYKLGELFRDMQVLSFVRPALANRSDLAEIQAGSVAAADQGVLDADLARRMESPREQMKALMVNLSEIGLVIGQVLIPPLVEISKAVLPIVRGFGEWAAENPALIKGVVGLVGGLLAAKLAFIGVQYGMLLVLSPINAVRTGVLTLSAKWTLLKALFQLGNFAPAVRGLKAIGAGFSATMRFLVPFSKGLAMTFGGPLMLLAKGGLLLGRVMGGALVSGLKLADQAVLWLGRALLLNPIGLAVTAIGIAAYTIYKYWEPISEFFSGLWSGVKGVFTSAWSGITAGLSRAWGGVQDMAATAWGGLTGFFSGLWSDVASVTRSAWDGIGAGLSSAWGSIRGAAASAWGGVSSFIGGVWGDVQTAVDGGVSGVTQQLLNWSPVGLLYQAISGGLSQLGIELPGKFSEFGANLMDGLIGGIRSMGTAVRDSVVGMGESVVGWFREKLGINSPSRVFMGFGANVSEGAALGIRNQMPLAGQAARALAGVVAAGGALAPLGVSAALPAVEPLTAQVQLLPRLAGLQDAPVALPTGAPPAGRLPPQYPDQVWNQIIQPAPTAASAPITFAPVIHVDAAAGPVRDQVENAMRMSFDEFSRLMEQYQHQNRRRSYGGE
ncbi:phage tail tape measure protein [Pseudomonas aeruginosa]